MICNEKWAEKDGRKEGEKEEKEGEGKRKE